jgi:hypothetical protein
MRFALAIPLAATLAVGSTGLQPDDRGRPLILLVHGRGMLDRDSATTRRQWFQGLDSGTSSVAGRHLIEERDVRVVWYADVLAPASDEACDFAPADVRARRDREQDPNLKTVASFAGSMLAVLTAFIGDGETGSELRALAGDASFLGDARKRCAAERRLDRALDRARAEGRPVILVAHSLGSLVAYDDLSSRGDTAVVERLVTIGSPVGSPMLRHLLLGGDSTDILSRPPSVKDWVNVRSDGDPLAAAITVGRDVTTSPPADELDPHEMIGYLRTRVTAAEIARGWCAAFRTGRPSGCKDVTSE